MTEFPHPRPSTYAGLFLVTLATLMHEILLTRIFSAAGAFVLAENALYTVDAWETLGRAEPSNDPATA